MLRVFHVITTSTTTTTKYILMEEQNEYFLELYYCQGDGSKSRQISKLKDEVSVNLSFSFLTNCMKISKSIWSLH